jgi:hypothetical protein
VLGEARTQKNASAASRIPEAVRYAAVAAGGSGPNSRDSPCRAIKPLPLLIPFSPRYAGRKPTTSVPIPAYGR